jgi:hypothetical protein
MAKARGVVRRHMTLIRFDPDTLAMIDKTAIRNGVACAGDHQALWVISLGGLYRVQPETMEASKKTVLPNKTPRKCWRALAVTTREGAVWVSDNQNVYKINATDGRVEMLIPLDRREDEVGWRKLLAGPEGVWVLDEPSAVARKYSPGRYRRPVTFEGLGRIFHINAATGDVNGWEFEAKENSWFLRGASLTDAGLWIPSVNGSSSLVLIDPSSGAVLREVAIGYPEVWPAVAARGNVLWYLSGGVNFLEVSP